MREPHLRMYVHLIWASWDRKPVLTPQLRGKVFTCMQEDCAKLNAELFAAGGTADHVHALVRLPATLCVADLVRQLKGSSSHLLNHECGLSGFRWQGAYAAFTLSKSLGRQVRQYILNQEKHHRVNTTNKDMELAWEEYAPLPNE